MPRDIIVFGEDWGGLPSSTQHLVSHLAKTRKILWVNSIGLRRPRLTLNDIKRVWRKLVSIGQSSLNKTSSANEPTLVVNPIALPLPKYWWERWLVALVLKTQLMYLMRKHRFCQPVFWTSLPTAVDLVGKLGDHSVVYYCGDDFSALAGVDHDVVNQREHELVELSDLVTAASTSLVEKFKNSNTQLLNHGVDFQLFSTPAPRALDLPNDGRPIAGYYGSLSEWIDIDLLEKVVSNMPHWHFVFIGKATIDVSSLQRFENTHFLGERAHHELPRYSQHWNASLLPFLDNAQIRACNPLKLREYLATGTPVITTEFPALRPYAWFVFKIDSAKQFIAALDKCSVKTKNNNQSLAVSEHDWSVRASTVSQWLETL